MPPSLRWVGTSSCRSSWLPSPNVSHAPAPIHQGGVPATRDLGLLNREEEAHMHGRNYLALQRVCVASRSIVGAWYISLMYHQVQLLGRHTVLGRRPVYSSTTCRGDFASARPCMKSCVALGSCRMLDEMAPWSSSHQIAENALLEVWTRSALVEADSVGTGPTRFV